METVQVERRSLTSWAIHAAHAKSNATRSFALILVMCQMCGETVGNSTGFIPLGCAETTHRKESIEIEIVEQHALVKIKYMTFIWLLKLLIIKKLAGRLLRQDKFLQISQYSKTIYFLRFFPYFQNIPSQHPLRNDANVKSPSISKTIRDNLAKLGLSKLPIVRVTHAY